MKTLSILLFSLLFTSVLLAQAPAAFKYQAVVRGTDSKPIANQNVGLKISILENSAAGDPVYIETHTVKTTDLGLVAVNVGQGLVISGTNLSQVDWSKPAYFIKVELDAAGGSNYQPIGTSQLLSVPYALFAEKAASAPEADGDPANEIQNLTWDAATRQLTLSKNGGAVNISADDADADPANEIQDLTWDETNRQLSLSKSGQTVNISANDADADPTNEIQTLAFDAATKKLSLSKGNEVTLDIAGGGSDSQTLAWNGNTQELSISGGNSVNIPLQGGAAAKLIQDADGDTRIQVEKNPNENRIRFTIKENQGLVYELSPTGHWLMKPTDVAGNIFFGDGAGQKNKYNSDSLDGQFNIFIGELAGSQNVVGSKNTFVGRGAGKLSRADENTFFGFNCGPKVQEGGFNTFVGAEAGGHMTTGSNNVFVGNIVAGTTNSDGSNNVMIGAGAGNFSEGSGNVFIGYAAGRTEKGDNKLYIHHNASLTPLIWGDFVSRLATIHGKLGIGTKAPASDFHIAQTDDTTGGLTLENVGANKNSWKFFTSNADGKLNFYSKTGGATPVASIDPTSGAFSSLSDERLKTDIEPMPAVAARLKNLEAKSYHFIGQAADRQKSFGFMAQDLQREFPELVNFSEENQVFHVNYGGLSVVALQSAKEQQQVIEQQQSEIDLLKRQNEDLQSRLEKLEALLLKK